MATRGDVLKILTLCLVCLTDSSESSCRQRVFTIAIGHDWGAHEYIDVDGYIKGFSKDLIAQVCAVAGMKCRTMWDKYTNCWDSKAGQHAQGGVGLLSGWYDACTGYVGSVDRVQVFDFSMPFFKPSKSHFWIKEGKSFNPVDLTGKKIGFMDGWVSDEKCLARHSDKIKHAVLEKDQIIHYATTESALKGLNGGEVDAVLQGTNIWDDVKGIERVDSLSFTCASTGNAMMTRKDNDFNSCWNKGLQQLIASGRFGKLCKESREKHAYKGDFRQCV